MIAFSKDFFKPAHTEPPAVTQLFLMREKPVHPGVYKWSRSDQCAAIWSYWNGEYWCVASYSRDQAFAYGKINSRSGDAYLSATVIGWRGLADIPCVDPVTGKQVCDHA